MLPVLLTIGPLPISSFGLFLALGFFAAAFVLWRLAKTYDFDEEKILDILILTFFGAIIGARVYFVIFHWSMVTDLSRIVLITRYPGLSFWGGLMGALVVFKLTVMRTKYNFWQLLDFGAVAALIGLSLGDTGCFLSGCAYGSVSNLPIATPVVGLIGKRFPVSAIEGLIFLVVFLHLWKQSVRFHFAGKLAAQVLIILGIVKLLTEFARGDNQIILPPLGISYGHVFSLSLIGIGLYVYYSKSKRHILKDLSAVPAFFYSGKKRKEMLYTLKKSCYNLRINFSISCNNVTKRLRKLPRKLKRTLNVKSTPSNIS